MGQVVDGRFGAGLAAIAVASGREAVVGAPDALWLGRMPVAKSANDMLTPRAMAKTDRDMTGLAIGHVLA
jgi:hypothetical protein